MASILRYIPGFFKTKWGIGILAVVIVGGGWYWYANSGKSSYQFITVTQGPITETVSVTGNTTPVSSVSLGFGNSGIVAHIYASVGDQVSAGSVLATLDTSDLSAQLQQAQANVDAQEANLAGLKAGARPEDIAASQAASDKSVQDLSNLYSGIPDIAADSYAKANDAVRTQLSSFFSSSESSQPNLVFATADSQAALDAENGRVAAGAALNKWQGALASLSPLSAPAAIDAAITSDLGYLSLVRSFLTSVSDAINSANNINAATLATDKAALAAAVTETNTGIKNLNTASQNIASQKLTVQGLQAQLALKQSGSTSQDIAAQEAQVEEVQAAVASIQAKLQNSEIVAPQSGVVTQFDAKVGQIAAPDTPLVSIISGSKFEVDAEVPETDIGKVAIGNTVSMTLDAFSGETFTGTVFYIDPAETILQGVVDYKVKVSFDKPDTRLKSGLTANLDIQTKSKDSVLILPQYAILQNDSGTFVETLVSGKVVDNPVTLGIEDSKGNVEIVSGATEGELVLNIGLKQ
jgi:HlyD family secretion protein